MKKQRDSSSCAQPSYVRPARLLRALYRLLFVDPNDTHQYYYITEDNRVLSGIDMRKIGDAGVDDILSDESRMLHTIVRDKEYLYSLPEGSLGRTYIESLDREGMESWGLIDIRDEVYPGLHEDYPFYSRVMRRGAVIHDMMHTVTGFGRDPAGETALMKTFWYNTGGLGYWLMWFVGCLSIAVKSRNLSVFEILSRGCERGKDFPHAFSLRWEEMLGRDLEEIREELGVSKSRYKRDMLPIVKRIMKR